MAIALRRHKPMPDGKDGRFGAIGDIQFLQNIMYVVLGGILANRKLFGNLVVGKPFHKQLQCLALAAGEGG